MERNRIEQAFAAMYEHSDRYPGCSMFSALPDAPVVEDRPALVVRLARAVAGAVSAAARRARGALTPRARREPRGARTRGARESVGTTP